jgi:HAE1 family hydrophobic/amphiphilic exporter-1
VTRRIAGLCLGLVCLALGSPCAYAQEPYLTELSARVPGLRDVPASVPSPEEADLPPLDLSAGALVLDLERAVAIALERNPALRAEVERLDEVSAGIEEALADALPQVALNASWSRSRNPAFLNNPDFEEIVGQFPGGSFEPSEQELYSVNAEVSQALFTFGKIRAAVELARLVGGVVDAQIEAARLETALVAAEAFYQALAARRAVEVVEAQEGARREALEVVEARYEIGDATELERLRSRSSLAGLGPILADRRGDVEVADSRLRLALGLPPRVELSLPEAPADLGAFARGAGLPSDLDVLIDTAFAERPELADLALQRDALEMQKEVIRADGRPRIDFDGSYRRQVRLIENLEEPLYADWLMAIGLRWEFFDGGRRKGQVAALESQRQQIGWRLRDLESRVVLEIETALARHRAALARLEAAAIAAESAREASRVAAETYREGVTLQADLLDAQQREVEAEIQLVDAAYAARLEAARLARAVGRYPTHGMDDIADIGEATGETEP